MTELRTKRPKSLEDSSKSNGLVLPFITRSDCFGEQPNADIRFETTGDTPNKIVAKSRGLCFPKWLGFGGTQKQIHPDGMAMFSRIAASKMTH